MKLFESIWTKIVIVDLINFENLYTLKLISIIKNSRYALDFF